MSEAAVLDLNDVVDGQKFNWRTIFFIATAVMVLISDGFDLAAVGYIAPELVKDWKIAPAELVPAFSAGIVGMMLGGPLLGFLGDKYGRKRVIIFGLCLIGITTLATIAASTIYAFAFMRFLTGIGIGGIIPNVIALVSEVTPKRIRGRLIVIVVLGVAFGVALPGVTAALLVPQFGWKSLLLVGGIFPLLVAVLSVYLLPESIKYLFARGDKADEVGEQARRLRPDLDIGSATQFSLPASTTGEARVSTRKLFFGSLLIVTPLLWICQATNQMANFFVLSWLPTLLQSAGASTAEAGAIGSVFAFGGFAGGLVLLFIIDRYGVIPTLVLFLIGAPLIAMMVWPGLSPGMHAAIIAGAGLCITGINLSLAALIGMIYPTAIRSMGAGWTQGFGRVGALAAPILGGILLNMKIPIEDLTLVPAGIFAIGAISCGVMAFICVKKFKGPRVEEFSII